MFFFDFFKKPAHNIHVKQIFDQLQKDGCILFNHCLEPKTTVPNFHCYPIISKKILYNPTISGLSDDTIRFFLLHEEGHHINGHFGYSLRGVFCLLGFILFVVGLFGSMSVKLNPFFYVVLCIIGIALVVFAFLGLKNLLKNDEYNSDIFAAMKLRDTYQKEDPPTIVKNGFIELENHFVNCNFGEHPLNKIENWSYDITEYHPTNVQRIESIKKSINKK